MHQFTHAWLAFLAIERLEKTKSQLLPEEQPYAAGLIEWFHAHKDCVIQGAWYPDSIIKDNSTSHILKIEPAKPGAKSQAKMNVVDPAHFKSLSDVYLTYQGWGKTAALRQQPFIVDESTNLPDRCESFTESFIDHMKIQWQEEKGSPVSPTSNQVAHLLFMQSHYVADAHVPMHCDARPFSGGKDLHAHVEDEWEKKVLTSFKVDDSDPKNLRFIYDSDGYPKVMDAAAYRGSYLERARDNVTARPLDKLDSLYKSSNNNTWDFMRAICQNSYLVSYTVFSPADIPDPKKADFKQWLMSHQSDFDKLSVAVLADAADSVSRVWLRAWRRYDDWRNPKPKPKKVSKNKVPAPVG